MINAMIICPFCNSDYEVKIANEDGYFKWVTGELIQNALPELSATDRESLISGLCPDCQKKIFG